MDHVVGWQELEVTLLPTDSTPDGVSAAPARTGHNFVDLIVACSAIGISIISLAIAVAHGRTMNKLVKANSWPFLQLETGNFDEVAKEDVITLRIRNTGVGPARLEAFRMSYRGKEMRSSRDLLKSCCAPPDYRGPVGGTLATSAATPRVIPAKEDLRLLWWLKPEGRELPLWATLDRERFRLSYEACYCSVFDECWVSPLNGERPVSVEDCSRYRSTGFER